MSKCKSNEHSKARRLVLKGGMLAFAGIASGAGRHVFAQEGGERISLDDPTAAALKYVHDASESEVRTDEEAFCHNCRFFQSDQQEGWAPCMLFQGKEVAAEGWCQGWVVKE